MKFFQWFFAFLVSFFVGSSSPQIAVVTIVPTPTPTPTVTPTPTPSEPGIHVPILLYHYISENPNKADIARNGLSTPPSVFEEQLQTLKANGYTPITLDEMAAAFSGASLPAKPVILTFDDGYEDFYLNAYPLLTKYQMKATAFIPTGFVGGGMFLTWAQIEEMSRSPYITFEPHSVHHYYMTKLSDSALMGEITESKKTLESHVGYKTNWFCYPYGAYDNRVAARVAQAGFIGGLTTDPGSWEYRSKFYAIPRYRAGRRTGESLLSLLR